jgi:CRISPR-associated protein Csx16
MAVYFVSRHQCAVEWIKRQSVEIDFFIEHLDGHQITSSDTVIGTLPLHRAAKVCQLGARYINLTMDIPAERRGKELTVELMDQFHARLESYLVVREKIEDE